MANGKIQNPSLGRIGTSGATLTVTLTEASMPYTVQNDGWIYAQVESNGYSDVRFAQLFVNGFIVLGAGGNGSSGVTRIGGSAPVRKGDVISCRDMSGSESYTVLVYSY